MSLQKRQGLRGKLLTGAVLLACTLHLSGQTTATKKKHDSDSDTAPRYSVVGFGAVNAWHLQQSNTPYPNTLYKAAPFSILPHPAFCHTLAIADAHTAAPLLTL